jgi:hypothetical protein
MFQVQINFDQTSLKRLLTAALNKWSSGAALDPVTINCDSVGKASAYTFLRRSGKVTMINFSHEVVVAGVEQMSAAEGNPLAAGSLVFRYIEGRGFGGGSSVAASAKAAPASTADGTVAADSKTTSASPGSIKFPGTVTVSFDQTALLDLIKAAAKRSGAEPTYATISFVDEQKASATITVKTPGGSGATGTISLSPAELNEALSTELTARGYTIGADAFRYTYRNGGYGGGSGTSVTVTLSVLPIV